MTSPQKPAFGSGDAQGHSHSADTLTFHASQRLYILLEKRPRPDNPDWVDIGFWQHSDTVEIMV
jgi:hypothetical protein